MNYNNDLFNDEELDRKSSYESKSNERGQDGLYRIDLDKVSPENKSRGYRAVLRFLPNITDNPEYIKAYLGDRYNEDAKVALGPSHYEKISHFLNFQQEGLTHLKGFYDDPTNINPKTQRPYTNEKWGPLAKVYFTLSKSNDFLVKQKANMINYNKKYFSYVLVIEDEQQPELVGKIMIFSYGKQIKDIIESESNGEATGVKCNVFSLNKGKDFVLLAKSKSFNNGEKEVVAPDYTKSRFYESTSSIKLPKFTDDGRVEKFIQIPLNEDGKIKPEHQEKVTQFLLSREVQLEDFAGQKWTEEQEAKVSEAIDYFTGKTSGGSSSSKSSNDEVDDFSFDSISSDKSEPVTTMDDELDDLDDLDF